MPGPKDGSLKTAVAAGVLGAFLIVSAGAMVWSGWQLWRGEQVQAAWARLPAGCLAVLQADMPKEAAGVWQKVARLPQLPGLLRDEARSQASIWAAIRADGDDVWTLCQDSGRATVATGEPPGAAVETQLASTWHVALAPLPGAVTQTLAHDRTFREALERVGGGQFHAFLRGPATEFVPPALLDQDPVAREFLALALWTAAALKVDGTHARLHVHIGTGQRGAVFLKQHLDPLRALDAAAVIDPAATVRGVARLNPAAWQAVRARHPLVHLLDRWHASHGEFDLGDAMTGQVGWQAWGAPSGESQALTLQLVRGEGREPMLDRLCQGRAAPVCRHAPGWLVVASDAESAERALQVATGARGNLRQAGSLDADEERLLTTTQGLRLGPGARVDLPGLQGWTGPLQVEALWLDTGLIAELALPLQ